MKTVFTFLSTIGLLTLTMTCAIAQTNTFPSSGSAGIGTITPNASSALEIKSSTQGMLIPRMTKLKRDGIISPAVGLLIYQTNSTPGFYYFDGAQWLPVTTVSANNTLSNLTAPTAINTDLLPDGVATRNIGSANNYWRRLYLSGPVFILGRRVLFCDTTNFNTWVGGLSGFSNNGGSWNTATGSYAMYYNTTGYRNTANGFEALYYNTSGNYNTANGSFTLLANTTGGTNTANGAYSLYTNTTGNANSANGFQSLYLDTVGSFNVANGYQSLYSSNANFNTANGAFALYSNTSGISNTANGYNSLTSNTTGYQNTGDGFNTLISNITGYNNTALGWGADATSGNQSNATAIGYNAKVDASNKVRVGNADVVSIGGQVDWTTFSDGRYKKNIKEDVKGLAFINSLKPITYTVDINGLNTYYNRNRKHDEAFDKMKKDMQPSADEASKIVYNGFIAQDVEAAANRLNYNFSGVDKPKTADGLYGLRYADFVVPLVKGMQELSKMNDSLKETVTTQQSSIKDLQKQLNDLKTLVLSIQQCSPCNSSGTTEQTYNTTITDDAALEQNIPNPFTHSTSIGYTLPQKYITAQIMITDKTGKTLKLVNVSGAGKGKVNVDASTLAAGAYNYSLLVDGKLIGTKQMILAK